MKQFLLLALLFFGTLVSAQKFSINGSVEGGGEMLASATVVVLNEKDSTIVSFGLTSKEGKFRIDNLKPLSYLIQITYLGFEQYSQPLVIEDSDIDLKTVTLKVNSALIEQVEIKGEHVPLLVKKDTLEFNAAAFQTQPNEVVEDLLKKLPGVEVESDGSIKAQGEDVEQVLVDGKKFFGDDPTIATRNLPADAVDKVQIFDQKSDMAEFSGVDDGERQKTINLELKEDRKNGYFGNLSAGYGSDDRYNGKISLNRFNPTTQMSIIGNFNNVNEQGFSVSDYASFMGGFGGFRRGGNAPIFNGLSNGFVVTNAGGLNINHDFSDKTELSINYFINSIENEIESESIKENFVSESESFFENENSDQINKSDNHRVNLEFEHEIDSTQDLRIRGGLTYNNGNLISDNYTEIVSDNFVANLTDSDYQTNGKNLNLSSNLTYRKKFGSVKKRIFTFNGSLNDATNDLLADLNSQNIIFSDNNTLETLLVQDVIQSDQDNQYRLEFSFVEPLSYGKYLEFKYRRQNFNNDVLTEYFDIEADMQTLNQDLSNAYVRDYYYDRYSTAFHFNSDVSQLTLEAAVQNSHLQGDLLFEEISIKKDVLRFLPRINWRYEIGQAHNIRLSYSTNVNMPSLEQLQPIPDNSNPLNIYIGNPDLIPEYSHRLRLNYFKYDQFNFRSFYAFFNFNYTKNQIINESFIDENFVQMQSPTNVDYNFNSTGSA
ncbi:MAG: TonB-dependent receptor family protein, partial [Bacteroidia bacterium]|nr:TonB-dependent receptor family protein [Bacteroidia bacterium]